MFLVPRFGCPRWRQIVPAAVGLWLILAGAAWAAPQVVVSIPPLHSLTAAVMDGVGRPVLLLRGTRSPHDHSLRPSQAAALENADLVVWVGEGLEAFLGRALTGLAGRAEDLEVIEIEGLVLLANREVKTDPGHDDDHGHDHGHYGRIDPHLWLDPVNARLIAKALAARLATLDPANAVRYRTNATRLAVHLDALDLELGQALASVKGRRYLVYHDAYRYFARRYGLGGLGAVTLDAARKPGAGRLMELRRQIAESGVRCLFHEPQFPAALLTTLAEDHDVRAAELDPLGVDLDPGPVAYFTLLRRLAKSFRDCLE